MSGAAADDELAAELLKRQPNDAAELRQAGRPVATTVGGGGGSGKPPSVSVPLLSRYARVFAEAFETGNVVRQILSTFRLGQEYLLAPQFYTHALMCLNASKFLCLKNYTTNPEGMDLMAEAIDSQVATDLQRARTARGDFPLLVMEPTDQFAEYQQRHYGYVGKLALADALVGPAVDLLKAQLPDAERTGFPEHGAVSLVFFPPFSFADRVLSVLKTLQELFDEEST